MSLTPGNDGCIGDVPDSELKYGFVLDNDPFSVFLEEQSVRPLPRTLTGSNKQLDMETFIPNLDFADLLDLLLGDTFYGVRGGSEEAARQRGDDNCAVVAGTYKPTPA